MKIHTIGFDGINRCGKGTQIDLLERHLAEKDAPVVIVRGDGSRKGDGTRNDPYSSWWSEIQPHLRDEKGNCNDLYYWNLASQRLNDELYETFHVVMPKVLKDRNKQEGYILMDRSIISRLFMQKRQDKSITLENLVSYESTDGNRREVILPDVAYVLHASKDTLLKRNENKADHPDKYLFRKRVLLDSYDDFEETTKGLYTPRFAIHHVDAEKDPQEISRYVISTMHDLGGYKCTSSK